MSKLLSQSTRQRSKDLLSIEIRKVQTEISRLQEESGRSATVKPSPVSSQQKCYEVKLSNYGKIAYHIFKSLPTYHNFISYIYCTNFLKSILKNNSDRPYNFILKIKGIAYME